MSPPKNKGQAQQTTTGAKWKAELDEIREYYDEKLNTIKTQFEAKLETLHKIIEKKDDVIGKLNNKIGELEQSLNFLSGETSDIKKKVEDNAKAIKSRVDITDNQVETIRAKTIDLEDRSRRCNLVFFNFPEVNRHATEDCEQTVENLLNSLNVDPEEDVWIDRAHRLGKRKPQHDTKPRPIIVKFSYYKQKERILRNGYKFKNSHVNMSEDFSKETLLVRSHLFKYGKDAKEKFDDPVKGIKQFKVSYKRLVITYIANKNDPATRLFTKSFSLDDIHGRSNWFIPPQGYSQNLG